MELRRGQEEAQGAQTAPGADSKHRDKSPWALQGDGQDATHQRKEKSAPGPYLANFAEELKSS